MAKLVKTRNSSSGYIRVTIDSCILVLWKHRASDMLLHDVDWQKVRADKMPLIVLGIRRDGQKVVLAIKNMGGETEAAWRAVLDDLLARGLAKRSWSDGT